MRPSDLNQIGTSFERVESNRDNNILEDTIYRALGKRFKGT